MNSPLLRLQPENSPSPATHPAPRASLANRALRVWWKVLGLAPSNTSPATHAAIIAGAMLVVAAVSWGRLAVRGTLSQVGDGVISAGHWTWMASLLAVALYLAGRSFAHVAYYGTADLSIRRIVLLGAAVHATSLPALPLLSGDVYVNLATGRLLNLGFDPLIHPPASLPAADPFRACVVERWKNTVTPYGPLLMWFHAPAAAAGSVVGGLLVFKLLFAALIAFMLWIAARYALCDGATPAARTGLAMAAWNPISSSEFLGQLHSDVFPVAAAMAFVWCARRGRIGAASASAAAALFSKVVVLPAVGLYLVFLARRRPAYAVGAAAIVAAVGAAAYLPFWSGTATFDGLRAAVSTDRERFSGSVAMLLYQAVRHAASPQAAAVWQQVWSFGIGLALSALALHLVRKVRTSNDVVQGAFVFTLAYLTCGTGWVMPWYAAWLIPWMFAIRNPGAVRAGACFTALAPILYMPDAAELRTVVFTLAVHLTPWCAWRRYERGRRLRAAESVEIAG